jgi:hypothetical protein
MTPGRFLFLPPGVAGSLAEGGCLESGTCGVDAGAWELLAGVRRGPDTGDGEMEKL